MKIKQIRTFSFCLLYLFVPNIWAQTDKIVEAQHTILGQNAAGQASGQKTRKNDHPDAQWFPSAGLGLFIHFGLAAQYGGGDLSWCMFANKPWEDGEISPVKYWGIADQWNPSGFKPKEWIKLVTDAGFKYIVFTTKHHDGYTLWPSKYGDFGVKQKMNGRDLVKEVIDACHEYDLKVGLYYSPPDWYFDKKYINWDYSGKSVMDVQFQTISSLPQKPKDHEKERRKMVAAQLEELLTNYGRIDLLWFDGGSGEITNERVRELQPGIVINRRNGETGDYGDSEGVLPSARFEGWFETCDPCWPSRWWSYSTSDRMDRASEVIEKLVILRAWGGNYLANVGPQGNGVMPKEAIAAWEEMAEWMAHSGESIFDTTAGGFPETSNQPVTLKGNVAYLHAFPNFHKTLEMQIQKRPKQVIRLRTGEEIPFGVKNGVLSISILPQQRVRMVDTVKIIWED